MLFLSVVVVLLAVVVVVAAAAAAAVVVVVVVVLTQQSPPPSVVLGVVILHDHRGDGRVLAADLPGALRYALDLARLDLDYSWWRRDRTVRCTSKPQP